MEWDYPMPAKITCPECGLEATINMHEEQGQVIDYFYECKCGKITEVE